MTGAHAQFRLATTAIIAALAFVSAPLPAQETPPPDTSVEPVTPAADPLAPEPEATTSSATETTAESATVAPRSEQTRERTASPQRREAAVAPPRAPAESAPATESSPTPAEATPAAATELPAAPPVRVAPAESRLELMNRVLPIGAALVLGLLALVATLLLLRRRRRRRAEWIEEQEAYAAAELPAEPAEPAPEPAFIAPPAALAPVAVAPRHDPVPSGPATALPEGFDVSRFGRHVQAAYRGPTPDNPSLSLKNRLRRASAMDQRERAMQAAGAEPAAPVPAPASGSFVTARPRARPTDGGFMLSGDGPKAIVRRAHSEESTA